MTATIFILRSFIYFFSLLFYLRLVISAIDEYRLIELCKACGNLAANSLFDVKLLLI